MNATGHIFIESTKYLILKRQSTKYYTYLKFRKSGKENQHLLAEEQFLTDKPDLITKLQEGKTIKI